MKLTIEDVRSRFKEHFDGATGSVYASPGRINLIGEHTDYNNGYVFPGAVEQGMIAEIKPNGTRTVRAYSIDLKDYTEFSLDDEKGPSATWARYIFGVCREMMRPAPQAAHPRSGGTRTACIPRCAGICLGTYQAQYAYESRRKAHSPC